MLGPFSCVACQSCQGELRRDGSRLPDLRDATTAETNVVYLSDEQPRSSSSQPLGGGPLQNHVQGLQNHAPGPDRFVALGSSLRIPQDPPPEPALQRKDARRRTAPTQLVSHGSELEPHEVPYRTSSAGSLGDALEPSEEMRAYASRDSDPMAPGQYKSGHHGRRRRHHMGSQDLQLSPELTMSLFGPVRGNGPASSSTAPALPESPKSPKYGHRAEFSSERAMSVASAGSCPTDQELDTDAEPCSGTTLSRRTPSDPQLDRKLRFSQSKSFSQNLLGKSTSFLNLASVLSGKGEDDAPRSRSSAKISTIWIVPKVMKKLNALRENMAQRTGPSQMELDRGMQISNIYDFYTVAEKKVRARRMWSGVFHHRYKEDELQNEDLGDSSSSDSDWDDEEDERGSQGSAPKVATRESRASRRSMRSAPGPPTSRRSLRELPAEAAKEARRSLSLRRSTRSERSTGPAASPRNASRAERRSQRKSMRALNASKESSTSRDSPPREVEASGSDGSGGEQRAHARDEKDSQPSSGASSDTPGSVQDDTPRPNKAYRQLSGSAEAEHFPTRQFSDPGGSPAVLTSASADREMHPEVLVRWSVVVGKICHTCVMDFSAVTDKVRQQHKYRSHTGKPGTMFASVRERARVVVRRAWELAKRVAKEEKDKFDSQWVEEDLLVHLFSTEYVDMLALFANTARKILSVQPSLVEAPVPCRIFGDLHGQFRDLLLLFRAFGSPDERDAPNFVFNGDFVDRGSHQLETIGLLLALKVLLPEKVWLVRGNHEDRLMNFRYGFADECKTRLGSEFGPKVFEMIHKAFDQLPLACLVGQSVLVVHGGIGDGHWRLNDIYTITRPLNENHLANPANYWVHNLLWSDPIEDDDERDQGVFGVHESPRGERAAQFGWDVTKTFCARNGLSLIVRSHQSKQGSLGIDIMHENLLMRVFSARDYEGHGNDGAVLLITSEEQQANGGSLLTVKAQILRSTTKALQEEAQRKKEDETLATAMRTSSKTTPPMSPGRQVSKNSDERRELRRKRPGGRSAHGAPP